MFRRILIASTALVAAASAASAATTTTTFDLTAPWGSPDYGSNGTSFTLSDGTLDATFSGNYFKSIGIDQSRNVITSSDVRDADIGRWSRGAGIDHGRRDGHSVDGHRGDDFIQVNFSQDVMMHEVEFSYFDAYDHVKTCHWTWFGKWCSTHVVDDDDFRWMYDLSGDGDIGTGDWISANENANPFTAFGSVINDVFAFGAFEKNDDWKLKNLTVKYDLPPSQNPDPVPLPAGGLLVVSAFAAFAAVRRRQRG